MRFNEFNEFNYGDKHNNNNLYEVKMSPSALQKFLQSDAGQSMVAGFEAELEFTDYEWETVYGEPEYKDEPVPDTKITSKSSFIHFCKGYGSNPYFSVYELERLYDKFIELASYTVYQDELKSNISGDLISRSESLLKEIVDNIDIIRKELKDTFNVEFSDPIETVSDLQNLLETISKEDQRSLVKAVTNVMTINVPQNKVEIERVKKLFPKTFGEFIDEATSLVIEQIEDGRITASVFMTVIQDVIGVTTLEWPIRTIVNQTKTQKNKILDLFLEDTNGFGFDAKIDAKDYSKWSFEKDMSLTDTHGVEIVSPAMPLPELVELMPKFFEWVKKRNGTATENTGFHMSVSVPDHNPNQLDYVKMALFLGDEHILNQFDRINNKFTVPAVDRIAHYIKDYPTQSINYVKRISNNVSELLHNAILDSLITVDKFTSINPHEKYVEVRSAGNKNYFNDIPKLQNALIRYAYALHLAMNPELERREYLKKLHKFVHDTVGAELLLNLREIQPIDFIVNMLADRGEGIDEYMKTQFIARRHLARSDLHDGFTVDFEVGFYDSEKNLIGTATIEYPFYYRDMSSYMTIKKQINKFIPIKTTANIIPYDFEQKLSKAMIKMALGAKRSWIEDWGARYTRYVESVEFVKFKPIKAKQ